MQCDVDDADGSLMDSELPSCHLGKKAVGPLGRVLPEPQRAFGVPRTGRLRAKEDPLPKATVPCRFLILIVLPGPLHDSPTSKIDILKTRKNNSSRGRLPAWFETRPRPPPPRKQGLGLQRGAGRVDPSDFTSPRNPLCPM